MTPDVSPVVHQGFTGIQSRVGPLVYPLGAACCQCSFCSTLQKQKWGVKTCGGGGGGGEVPWLFFFFNVSAETIKKQDEHSQTDRHIDPQ